MKIASIADIHVELNQAGIYKDLFTEISQNADVLCISGDLTAQGLVEETHALSEELKSLTIPCVCVLGNHDYQQNQFLEIASVLSSEKVSVLQGTYKVINDIGFAGVKGFIGGFDNHILPMWGEQQIKDVVQYGIQEALELEKALSLLETEKKVVLMHYSPIKATVVGEDSEILPFLGSTRFEEVVNRMNANVVFHGHAHKGTLSGKTSKGITVFNVSMQVLEANKKRYLVYEV